MFSRRFSRRGSWTTRTFRAPGVSHGRMGTPLEGPADAEGRKPIPVSHAIREWWIRAMLGQQQLPHPRLGREIRVGFDGEVVTLTGEVDSIDQAEQLEHEVRSMSSVRDVINRLIVVDTGERYHMQTVIAVFSSVESAQLACHVISDWMFHPDAPPDILVSPADALPYLAERAQAARAPIRSIERYVDAVRRGKVLVVGRIPEDDALRMAVALEDTLCDSIHTLPPEPDCVGSKGRNG